MTEVIPVPNKISVSLIVNGVERQLRGRAVDDAA